MFLLFYFLYHYIACNKKNIIPKLTTKTNNKDSHTNLCNITIFFFDMRLRVPREYIDDNKEVKGIGEENRN